MKQSNQVRRRTAALTVAELLILIVLAAGAFFALRLAVGDSSSPGMKAVALVFGLILVVGVIIVLLVAFLPGAKATSNEGTQLVRLCGNCGNAFDGYGNVCPECGSPVAEDRVAIQAVDNPPKRKTPVTLPAANPTSMIDMDKSVALLTSIQKDMRRLVELNEKQHFWLRALGVVFVVVPLISGGIWFVVAAGHH